MITILGVFLDGTHYIFILLMNSLPLLSDCERGRKQNRESGKNHNII